jgi:hypothetical protein
MNEIIEKARELLEPIEYDPDSTGYYVRTNDDCGDGWYCERCIKKELARTRKYYKERRKEIIRDWGEIMATGYWREKNIRKREFPGLSDAEFIDEVKNRMWRELKNYPARATFEIEGGDPDFGGGQSEPQCCDECGKYFHTDFVPDMDMAVRLLDDALDIMYSGKWFSPELAWKLDIALYNYNNVEDKDVQEILMVIAKFIIRRSWGQKK